MFPKRLPKELVSLIHHIELNKAGWWDRAIQHLIEFVMWFNSNRPMTISEVLDTIQTELGVTIDTSKAQEAIKQLVKENKVVTIDNGRFKIAEKEFVRIGKQAEEVEKLEQIVKAKFIDAVTQFCPFLEDLSQVWNHFNDSFLVPFVSEMGAYVFQLVSEGTYSLDIAQLGRQHFDKFISKYRDNLRKGLQEAIIQFLNPKDTSVRSYILRIMNACFYVEASGLKTEVLENLTQVFGRKPSFSIFVDTNFLFSILDLHENPLNEAADALIELGKRISRYVKIKFYVTPLTLDEAKRVLIQAKASLEGIRPTPNLVKGAAATKLSGIVSKFIEAGAKDPSVTAESFFNPYIKDLLSIAQSRGIELFNQNFDEYKKKQEVIDDIIEQQNFENRKYGSRAKTYEALQHDVVLWHFVKDKRPAYVESPLDAQYWIVTVDYRFMAFDAYKRGKEGLPICMLPTTLAQMLRFWVPQTDVLDESVVASLRLPFLFPEFDPEAEKVTIAILKTLSRFEKVDDFPVETVKSLLLNEALRERMKDSPDEERQIELVKEALIEENTRLRQQLLEKEKIEGKQSEMLQKFQESLERERSEKQRLEDQYKEKIKELELKIKELTEEIRAKEEKEEKLRKVNTFVIKWVILPIMGIAAVVIGLWIMPFFGLDLGRAAVVVDGFHLRLRIVWGTFAGLLMLLWLWIVDFQAKKQPVMKEHLLVRWITKFKDWLLGIVASGILINALWDWIKMLVGFLK